MRQPRPHLSIPFVLLSMLLPLFVRNAVAAPRGEDRIAVAPAITGFSPVGGPVGTLVTITGSGFTGTTSVRFNTRPTGFSVFSDTQIAASVPAGATSGTISVATPSGTANSAANFFVGLPPTVTGFTPNAGTPGTVVTINGNGFLGATAVRFGGQSSGFTVLSATSISATVPAGAVTGSLTVVNPAGSGGSSAPFYLPAVISGFVPAGGPVGTQVTLFGSGFTIVSSVAFNGVGAGFTVDHDGQLRSWVPAGASSGPIALTSAAGTGTSSISFFVGQVPSIVSFEPSGGPPGTAVTIHGANFDGVAEVTFDGVSAAYSVANANEILATVPFGAATGPITVTNPAGSGSSSDFFVGSAPNILGVAPVFGPIGNPVSIHGSGFGGVTSVRFNGTAAAFVIVADSAIATSVPVGARTGPLAVTNPSGSDSIAVFGVSPAITSFSPSCLSSANRHSTPVSILGSNFSGAQSVRFNGVEAGFVVDSDSRITSTIPEGDVDGSVSVSTPYGTAVGDGAFSVIDLPPASHSAGEVWPHGYAENLPVCTAAGGQSNAVSAPDGTGGVVVAWQDTRNGEADIFALRITAHGSVAPGWPVGGVALCAAPGSQIAPVIVADNIGGAIVAWQDGRTGGWDIYAQRVTSNGSIEPPWPENGLALCTAANDQVAPTLCEDGSCGAIVAWQDSRFGALDVFAQRVTSLGTIAAGWPANGAGLCTVGGDQLTPSTATDGNGGAFVVWEDRRYCRENYVTRMTAEGTLATGWPDGGRRVADYFCLQSAPHVIADGTGGAFVAWQDDRCYTNLYVQHLDLDGSAVAGWPSQGLAVSDYCRYGYLTHPRLIRDSAAGVFVCWEEHKSFGSGDIMIDRMTANGGFAEGWFYGGKRLTNDFVYEQQSPEMVPDGWGGAIVTWHDQRRGEWDIFAQRVLPDGSPAPSWGATGNRVTTPVRSQLLPTVVPGLGGSAIVSWQDDRTGSYDIYAQRVDGSGRLGNPEPILTGVGDLAADQGGRVRMQWSASYLDTLPTLEIGAYGIWRRVTAPAAAAAIGRGAHMIHGVVGAEDANHSTIRQIAGPEGLTYWEGVASILARGQSSYTFVAPTFIDSTAAGNPYSTFMVDAHAAAFPYFWSSFEDSGYSVDNLPPAQPAGFGAQFTAGSALLHWRPNIERDLAGYRMHRGTSPDFVPGSGNLVASTSDTTYADPASGPSFTYKLVAVDVHGNAGSVAVVSASGSLDAPGSTIPATLSLGPATPNPVREGCAIHLALPRSGTVRLALFDASGRAVRILIEGDLAAGDRMVVWDGRDGNGRPLPSGIYLFKLESMGRSLTRRLVLVR